MLILYAQNAKTLDPLLFRHVFIVTKNIGTKITKSAWGVACLDMQQILETILGGGQYYYGEWIAKYSEQARMNVCLKDGEII